MWYFLDLLELGTWKPFIAKQPEDLCSGWHTSPKLLAPRIILHSPPASPHPLGSGASSGGLGSGG